jgi:hypothetical protein
MTLVRRLLLVPLGAALAAIAAASPASATPVTAANDVRAPAQATIVDAFDGHGVYLCGPAINGEGTHLWLCHVSPLAAGQAATIDFHLSATTPLPAGATTRYGTVHVNGYNKPDAYPDDTVITYSHSPSPVTSRAVRSRSPRSATTSGPRSAWSSATRYRRAAPATRH